MQSGSWFYLEPPFLEEYGYAIYDGDRFTGKYRVYPQILVEETNKVNATAVFFGTWRTHTESETPEHQALCTRAYAYVLA